MQTFYIDVMPIIAGLKAIDWMILYSHLYDPMCTTELPFCRFVEIDRMVIYLVVHIEIVIIYLLSKSTELQFSGPQICRNAQF